MKSERNVCGVRARRAAVVAGPSSVDGGWERLRSKVEALAGACLR